MAVVQDSAVRMHSVAVVEAVPLLDRMRLAVLVVVAVDSVAATGVPLDLVGRMPSEAVLVLP